MEPDKQRANSMIVPGQSVVGIELQQKKQT